MARRCPCWGRLRPGKGRRREQRLVRGVGGGPAIRPEDCPRRRRRSRGPRVGRIRLLYRIAPGGPRPPRPEGEAGARGRRDPDGLAGRWLDSRKPRGHRRAGPRRAKLPLGLAADRDVDRSVLRLTPGVNHRGPKIRILSTNEGGWDGWSG